MYPSLSPTHTCTRSKHVTYQVFDCFARDLLPGKLEVVSKTFSGGDNRYLIQLALDDCPEVVKW